MSTPLSPTSGGLLLQLRQQLQGDVDKSKTEIEQKVGAVITNVHAKINEVDQSIHKLNEAGKVVMDTMEKEKAEMVTHIQGFVAEAGLEFGKHRCWSGCWTLYLDNTCPH